MARRARDYYEYIPDHGDPFAVLIPVDQGGDAARGWTAAATTLPIGADRCKMRHVLVKNASGQSAKAVCGSVACDLWDGTATTFTVDGVTYQVTGYSGERRTVRTSTGA